VDKIINVKQNLIKNIDHYIATFPKSTQKILQEIREVIIKSAPKANECIKYAMPTFEYFGNLVHFAGYKNHIGFYPSPSGLVAYKEEIKAFKNSKGAVQFPLDQPLPISLIAKIVAFRVKENELKMASKRIKKKCPMGHIFYKSSDCPTCPICANNDKAKEGFLTVLSAPAQRALINANIHSLKILAQHSESEILALHGIGKSSIPKLKEELKKNRLKFKTD
jgi:uncharacterized protein YdhG (YjbR/CyaY superfamily)